MPTTNHTVQLALISEKRLPAKCKPHTLTYCPTIDLIALATEDDQVHVFRFNGQEALGNPFTKAGISVKCTRWKNSGRLLAVAGSDNHVRLISTYYGNIAHDLSCGVLQDGDTASISCLGWGVHETDGGDALEDLLRSTDVRPNNDEDVTLRSRPQVSPNLPRELALLDIERSLPKLSVLPSTGDDDDVFSSRASLDSIFDTTGKNSSSGIDVLLVGFDDGTVHLRLFNSFEIGSFNVRSSFPDAGKCTTLQHAFRSASSTHSLLFSISTPESDHPRLGLLTLDLRFMTKSGRYLPLLASKITHLQNLLRYIKQVQHQIQLEWKNAQDLPSRYISNVDEELQEKCQCDFVTAAYHLLVTGDCFEPLKEFLVDQLGERGHKRWDRAVASGYESIQRLLHMCLLPALERCGVILSRLIGLSKYHRLSPVLGLETKHLKECQETVDCLNLMAHKLLIHCRRESREFGAFSKWLRHEVDLQTADPLSNTAEEEMEKSDTIDYVQTMNYVRGAMTRSALLSFIRPAQPDSEQGQASLSNERDGSFYESFKNTLRQQDQNKSDEHTNLPTLRDLITRLKTQCDKVFKQIAETQKRGVLHRSPLRLSSDCDEHVTDMFATCEQEDTRDVIWIASRSKNCPYKFYCYRVVLETINGVSSTKKIQVSTISLQGGHITDMKYVPQDKLLMVLWRDANPSPSTHLVGIPLDSSPGLQPTNEIPLDPNNGTAGNLNRFEGSAINVDFLDPGGEENWIRHTFPPDEVMPMRFEVNANKGRRAICVLYSDGLRYSVFDMDSIHDGAEDENEEQEEDGGEESDT
ncbi:hypothetical protein VTO42DRAFT_3376 [Malbranchea cinnamomea]